MLRPKMFRLIAALVLATGLLLTLPGCGNNKTPSETKVDKKTDTSNASPPLNINADPNLGATTDTAVKIVPILQPIEKIDLNLGVGKDATDFLTSLKNGAVRGDQLSNGFVKAIGVPVVFAADKAKGFSADAAEGLLKRTLARHYLGPPYLSKQVGNVALFRGTFIGEDSGGFSLRMIHEGELWKVDWFSLTSVSTPSGALNTSAAESVCQEFTVAAVIGLLTDKNALVKEDRAVILAAGLTPALKKKWAEPLDSDKAEGFDYNRGTLGQKTLEYGAGVESYSFTQQGNAPVFRVEFIRSGSAKAAYLVKLINGSGPGQWLVDDVIPQ
jgi:hypothetical protein